jgi:drug/metabolite transporter (DMT)-like permease
MLLAALAMAVQSAMVKDLGATLASVEIAFFRGLFGVAMILPFMDRRDFLHVRTRHLGLHVGRALAGVTSMICTFYAFINMPLANATAITFTMPLFMIVLAVPFLNETVRWRRWTSTIVGFCGVLIIVRPGTHMFEIASIVALAGAFAFALVGVFIKKLAKTESVSLIIFYFSVFATVAFLVPSIVFWKTPSATEFTILLAVTFLGFLSQVGFVHACKIGDMTAVVPFDYSRLVFAGILGFLVFDEVPDLPSFIGAGIVVASTLYIAYRESKLHRLSRGRKIAAPAEP